MHKLTTFLRQKLKIRGIFLRFILILFLPIIIIQIINAYVFYDRHWEDVEMHLAKSVTNELQYIDTLITSKQHAQASVAIDAFDMRKINNINADYSPSTKNSELKRLNNFLHHFISPSSYAIIHKKQIEVYMPNPQGDYYLKFSRKRIISPTTYIYTNSLIITACIIFVISFIFLKNQVRNIVNLSRAVESFGRSGKVSNLSPSGPFEIRKLTKAFIMMQQRISQQTKHRRELLSHISHDLRTPLTRLKLKLEIMEDSKDTKVIKHEISEMERMLNTYLEFAKAEGNESQSVVNLGQMVAKIVAPFDTKSVEYHNNLSDLQYSLKPIAFERALNNLLDNAIKYANSKIIITLKKANNSSDIAIIIEDDGKGIDDDKIIKMTEPFVKGDGSKSHGLGLAIVKSIIQSHGGDLTLGRSKNLGGLWIKISLPN